LTEPQKTWIEKHPQGESHQDLLRFVQERAGGPSPSPIPIEDVPAFGEGRNTLLYVTGLLALKDDEAPRLTPEQARALLPYVAAFVKMEERHRAVSEKLMKVLDTRQVAAIQKFLQKPEMPVMSAEGLLGVLQAR
jgi:hypothetical protein